MLKVLLVISLTAVFGTSAMPMHGNSEKKTVHDWTDSGAILTGSESESQLPFPPALTKKLNNGIREASQDEMSFFGAALKDVLSPRDELKDCKDTFTVERVWIRGPTTVPVIKCGDKRLYANMDVKYYQIQGDMNAVPELATGGMTGGWNFVDAMDLEQAAPFFQLSAGSDADKCSYSKCRYQVVNGFNYYCQVDCDGTVRHLKLYKGLDMPEVEIVSIADKPESHCFQKLAAEYMSDLIQNSNVNTEVFLTTHCGFTGELSQLDVTGGSYIRLPTGTQFCVTVSDGTMSTTLAMYKYDLEGTVPFMVAHPFPEGIQACNYFAFMIANLWGMKE